MVAVVRFSAYVDDVRGVIRSAPELYVLLDRDLKILEASDAYLALTTTTRDDLLGRPMFDAFPGEAGTRESLLRALADRRPDSIATNGRGPDRHWEVVNTTRADREQQLIRDPAMTTETCASSCSRLFPLRRR